MLDWTKNFINSCILEMIRSKRINIFGRIFKILRTHEEFVNIMDSKGFGILKQWLGRSKVITFSDISDDFLLQEKERFNVVFVITTPYRGAVTKQRINVTIVNDSQDFVW